MNPQTALVMFAMASFAVMPVLIAKQIVELRSKKMWWLILGLVVVAGVIWFINGADI